eukprot:scaffold2707_cov273-Chaetoceros_neogracile.AAC.13
MCTAAEAVPPTTVTFFGLNVQVAVRCTSIAHRVSAAFSIFSGPRQSLVPFSFCPIMRTAHIELLQLTTNDK